MRAIPLQKQIEAILDDTAMPIFWGKNQPGMSASQETNAPLFFRDYRKSLEELDNLELLPSKALPALLSVEKAYTREEAWLAARDRAIEIAAAFKDSGYHKQAASRILQPFTHTNMIISSTFWNNFFNLRLAEDAQPEIKALAEEIHNALANSVPTLIRYGQWHLPFIADNEKVHPIQNLRKWSTARLARVSYNNHDGTKPNPEKDLDLFGKLTQGHALHGSPLEHPATPIPKHHASNFYGWMQFRELLDVQPSVEYYEGSYNDY